MGFKSANCIGRDIIWKTCCSSVFHVRLAEFTSMLWVIILYEYKSLTYKLRFRRNHMILRYAVIADLIQFGFHLIKMPDFAVGNSLQHHNRLSSMLYGWFDTEGYSSFTNSSPYRSSFLTEIFRTLIHQFKGLYSTALLSSPFAPWPTEAFWDCFASATVVPW